MRRHMTTHPVLAMHDMLHMRGVKLHHAQHANKLTSRCMACGGNIHCTACACRLISKQHATIDMQSWVSEWLAAGGSTGTKACKTPQAWACCHGRPAQVPCTGSCWSAQQVVQFLWSIQ